MKIGIALYHINPRVVKGITVYALSVLEAFRKVDKNNQYFLLVRDKDAGLFEKYAAVNFKIVIIRSFQNKIRRKISYFLQNYVFIFPVLRLFYGVSDSILNNDLVREIDSLNLDVLYFPSGALYPLSLKTKSVVSIHDIQYDHFPNFFTIFERFGRRAAHIETVRKAKYIQASSKFVGRDFVRYFKCNPEKVVLVRDGVDSAFNSTPLGSEKVLSLRSKYNLPEKFVFYPAQHWPHKNHITMIKALSYLKLSFHIEIPLVLTGSLKAKNVNLEKETEKNKVRDQVIFVGNIPFEDLTGLYKIATIVCIPTLHESNSLPLIEALASGTATIASDIEPNIEINTNSAVTIFKRLDYKDLALKTKELFENELLRKEKIQKGLGIAKDYSWDNTAKNYIKLFEKLNWL
jgi:glycosyltransferase involved in cell wall biosynthesis